MREDVKAQHDRSNYRDPCERPGCMSAPSAADEEAIEATKAPLVDHLIELRKRLIISVAAFLVCFLFCFVFARYIYAFLTEPLARALAGQPNHHLIYTA